MVTKTKNSDTLTDRGRQNHCYWWESWQESWMYFPKCTAVLCALNWANGCKSEKKKKNHKFSSMHLTRLLMTEQFLSVSSLKLVNQMWRVTHQQHPVTQKITLVIVIKSVIIQQRLNHQNHSWLEFDCAAVEKTKPWDLWENQCCYKWPRFFCETSGPFSPDDSVTDFHFCKIVNKCYCIISGNDTITFVDDGHSRTCTFLLWLEWRSWINTFTFHTSAFRDVCAIFLPSTKHCSWQQSCCRNLLFIFMQTLLHLYYF